MVHLVSCGNRIDWIEASMGYMMNLVHVVTLLMNSQKYVPVLIAGLLSSSVRFMSPQLPTPTPIASVMLVGQLKYNEL